MAEGALARSARQLASLSLQPSPPPLACVPLLAPSLATATTPTPYTRTRSPPPPPPPGLSSSPIHPLSCGPPPLTARARRRAVRAAQQPAQEAAQGGPRALLRRYGGAAVGGTRGGGQGKVALGGQGPSLWTGGEWRAGTREAGMHACMHAQTLSLPPLPPLAHPVSFRPPNPPTRAPTLLPLPTPAAEVLLALQYLHLLGFVYRDLKVRPACPTAPPVAQPTRPPVAHPPACAWPGLACCPAGLQAQAAWLSGILLCVSHRVVWWRCRRRAVLPVPGVHAGARLAGCVCAVQSSPGASHGQPSYLPTHVADAPGLTWPGLASPPAVPCGAPPALPPPWRAHVRACAAREHPAPPERPRAADGL